MDDMEDDARYPPNPRAPASHRKLPMRTPHFSSIAPPTLPSLHGHNAVGHEDEDAEEEEEDEEGPNRNNDDEDDTSSDSRGKRRRLDKLALGFEFAPRAAPVPPASRPVAAPPPPGRGPLSDWTEESTFTLLEAWGDLYVQNGRRSLRLDEWTEVADRVCKACRIVRSNVQCRNRVDTLKKKYKKEKARLLHNPHLTISWVYFKKMDFLMSPQSPPLPSVPRQTLPRISGGVNGRDYTFPGLRRYQGNSNGQVKKIDNSPVDSGSEQEDGAGNDDDDDSDGSRLKSQIGFSGSNSYRMLAESIRRFARIYEKMENNKRQQMAELDRMRKDFQKDLEFQKRQILERARAEIAKMRQEEAEDDDEDKDDDGDDEEDIDASSE